MKDNNNKCPYTHQQLIDADRYAYNMAGSSPCESCKNNRHENLHLSFLCQDECEEYRIWWDTYCEYSNEYFDKLGNKK